MVAIAGFGLFGTNILARFPTIPHLSPDAISLIGAAVIGLLCLTSLRATGRALMALEGISVLAMLTLSTVVLTKVFAGHGPVGDPRLRMIFVPPDHVGLYAIALGLGFGFLSYSGFETAATLGREVPEAARTIPRTLMATVLTIGLICTVISAAEVLGFGLTAADMARFTASTSLLGDLATAYAMCLTSSRCSPPLAAGWQPPRQAHESSSPSCVMWRPAAHLDELRAIPARHAMPLW